MAEVDWWTLPADLLRRVGDCILATCDIDYYMAMRAVCHDWRFATVDPRANGAAAVDARFRPRRWVMLDEEQPQDGNDDAPRLFVNLSTGRFLRQRVPQLLDYVLVSSTTDGLLVLGSKNFPYAAGVLNPFTGALLRFDAPILPTDGRMIAAVSNDDPTKLFVYALGSFYDAMCAEPTTEVFQDQYFRTSTFSLASMVSHAGDVYLANTEGELIKTVGAVQRWPNGELMVDSMDLLVVPSMGNYGETKIFLVDCSTSELLLVRHSTDGVMDVLRVDAEKKDLEPVKSIGRRALFVGHRCLCVYVDRLPSVDGNCIYYTNGNEPHFDGMYRHDLEDGKEERISGVLVPGSKSYDTRPFSIVQLLLAYCSVLPDVQTQLTDLGWLDDSVLDQLVADRLQQLIQNDSDSDSS